MKKVTRWSIFALVFFLVWFLLLNDFPSEVQGPYKEIIKVVSEWSFVLRNPAAALFINDVWLLLVGSHLVSYNDFSRLYRGSQTVGEGKFYKLFERFVGKS